MYIPEWIHLNQCYFPNDIWSIGHYIAMFYNILFPKKKGIRRRGKVDLGLTDHKDRVIYALEIRSAHYDSNQIHNFKPENLEVYFKTVCKKQ